MENVELTMVLHQIQKLEKLMEQDSRLKPKYLVIIKTIKENVDYIINK